MTEIEKLKQEIKEKDILILDLQTQVRLLRDSAYKDIELKRVTAERDAAWKVIIENNLIL